MVDAAGFVDNEIRDALINKLLALPENKVSPPQCHPCNLGLLRLRKQEPQVVLIEHRHFPVLPVH